MRRVLVTSPPMLLALDRFQDLMHQHALEPIYHPELRSFDKPELIQQVRLADGWILGDDEVNEDVLTIAAQTGLRTIVKWGIGVDNIDFAAASRLGVQVRNTPDMFGDEIADLAMHYVTGLARDTFQIHKGVLAGSWPKPAGLSLKGRVAGVVGYGSVGREVVRRLLAARMRVRVYTRTAARFDRSDPDCELLPWPEQIEELDFVILCCPLTPQTRHMIGADFFARCRSGVRLVNVARGGVVDSHALVTALREGKVAGAALDVFEQEPLPANDNLRDFEQVIFGSHNASNTVDAVDRTSHAAIEKLVELMDSGK